MPIMLLFCCQTFKRYFKARRSLRILSIFCAWLVLNPVGMADTGNDQQLVLKAGISANSFPDVSAVDIEVTIKLLVEEIAKNAGFEAEVTAYTDERQMQQDFESGKINFVSASSLILVRDYDNTLFASGIRFVREYKYPDQMLIVGSAKYNSFNELRGKRLVLAQSDPLTELYADYMALKNFKTSYQNSFKVLPPAKVNQLLLKIFFGEADLTVVEFHFYKTALEMNPQLEGKLKILAQLDNIPAAGAFFHKDTPVAFQDKIAQAALSLGAEPRGRQLMDVFKTDRIYRSDLRDLIPAKQLFEARQQLISHR